MRPRVFPAEDADRCGDCHLRRGASMRPRVFPAEDANASIAIHGHRDCFNEAAGIPRGRPELRPRRREAPRASMRPRVFPAEDVCRYRRFRLLSCFNEAAGIPRGRRSDSAGWRSSTASFNEAAGIPRGRPLWHLCHVTRGASASMRPRVFPAEDLGSDYLCGAATHASMRPRVFPAEDAPAGAAQCTTALASMRPRVFPAEDEQGHRDVWCQPTGFNEAAGIPRGRRDTFRYHAPDLNASMRPRVFPAEDERPSGRCSPPTWLQ